MDERTGGCAVLSDEGAIYKKVTAVTHPDVDFGLVKIEFKDTEGETVHDVKYKLYSEQGDLLQDIDGFSDWNTFGLPLGKYYIEQYEVPNNYFLNSNRYEINIIEPDETVNIEVINESLDSLL